MGYVWTDEEVAESQRLMLERRFTSEAITIGFETTAEFVSQVLPPCFEPLDNRGTVSICTGRGAGCGEYGSGLVNLNVRYNGQAGQYTLTSIFANDMPVIVGREFYCEPKKRGDAALYRAGKNIYGYVLRHGVKIIEIDGMLDLTPQEPSVQEVFRYEVLGDFNHQAQLEGKPYVFSAKKRFVNDVVLQGEATLKFRSNGFDPVDEIPILGVDNFVYSTGEMDTVDSRTEYISDNHDYAPYILGRHYDLFTQYEVPAPLRVPFPLS